MRDGGGRVTGPRLKEMARLAHTEYFIEGRTDRDPKDVLRETMFAPTVTGSPLESACRVISRYETRGRGYYSGVAALITEEDDGRSTLDSAILIRTADIDRDGGIDLSVGSTLVRHSEPDVEVAETKSKAAGLLARLEQQPEAVRRAPGRSSRAPQAQRADRGVLGWRTKWNASPSSRNWPGDGCSGSGAANVAGTCSTVPCRSSLASGTTGSTCEWVSVPTMGDGSAVTSAARRLFGDSLLEARCSSDAAADDG